MERHCLRRPGQRDRARTPAAGTRALAEAVRRLLGDESFRLAAGRVRDAYATEDGAAACARSIESTLTG